MEEKHNENINEYTQSNFCPKLFCNHIKKYCEKHKKHYCTKYICQLCLNEIKKPELKRATNFEEAYIRI